MYKLWEWSTILQKWVLFGTYDTHNEALEEAIIYEMDEYRITSARR